MEGEFPESEEVTQPEREPRVPPYVELDSEYKIFVKKCSACSQEFRTNVPRDFFRNPDDESTVLNANGKNAAIDKIITNQVCPDVKGNAQALVKTETPES